MTDYTPTTQEVRNAWWRDQCPANDLDFDDVYNAAFDRWLAAHDAEVRQQGEPSDAQVEAGCAAFYEDARGLTSWTRLVSAEPDLADRYRDGIRAALRAARGAR